MSYHVIMHYRFILLAIDADLTVHQLLSTTEDRKQNAKGSNGPTKDEPRSHYYYIQPPLKLPISAKWTVDWPNITIFIILQTVCLLVVKIFLNKNILLSLIAHQQKYKPTNWQKLIVYYTITSTADDLVRSNQFSFFL